MGLMLNGKTLQASDENGEPLQDDSFLILVNASHEGVEFILPKYPNGSPWRHVMDTENIDDPFKLAKVGRKVILGGRSMMVFNDSQQTQGAAKVASTKSRRPRATSSSPPS